MTCGLVALHLSHAIDFRRAYYSKRPPSYVTFQIRTTSKLDCADSHSSGTTIWSTCGYYGPLLCRRWPTSLLMLLVFTQWAVHP